VLISLISGNALLLQVYLFGAWLLFTLTFYFDWSFFHDVSWLGSAFFDGRVVELDWLAEVPRLLD